MNWPLINLIGGIFFFVWFLPAFIGLLFEKQTRKNIANGFKEILSFKLSKLKDGVKILGGFLLFCCLGPITFELMRLSKQPKQKQ